MCLLMRLHVTPSGTQSRLSAQSTTEAFISSYLAAAARTSCTFLFLLPKNWLQAEINCIERTNLEGVFRHLGFGPFPIWSLFTFLKEQTPPSLFLYFFPSEGR